MQILVTMRNGVIWVKREVRRYYIAIWPHKDYKQGNHISLQHDDSLQEELEN